MVRRSAPRSASQVATPRGWRSSLACTILRAFRATLFQPRLASRDRPRLRIRPGYCDRGIPRESRSCAGASLGGLPSGARTSPGRMRRHDRRFGLDRRSQTRASGFARVQIACSAVESPSRVEQRYVVQRPAIGRVACSRDAESARRHSRIEQGSVARGLDPCDSQAVPEPLQRALPTRHRLERRLTPRRILPELESADRLRAFSSGAPKHRHFAPGIGFTMASRLQRELRFLNRRERIPRDNAAGSPVADGICGRATTATGAVSRLREMRRNATGRKYPRSNRSARQCHRYRCAAQGTQPKASCSGRSLGFEITCRPVSNGSEITFAWERRPS